MNYKCNDNLRMFKITVVFPPIPPLTWSLSEEWILSCTSSLTFQFLFT